MKNTRFTEEQKAFALRQAESGVQAESTPSNSVSHSTDNSPEIGMLAQIAVQLIEAERLIRHVALSIWNVQFSKYCPKIDHFGR